MTKPGRGSLHARHGHTIRKVEGGFPHSEIPGSKLVRSSPRLIAAYHVLHRLSAPRHPPNALKALDRSHDRCPPTIASSKAAADHPTTRSKKQKDRSSSPFGPKDLMLAEHDRCGPALAATTATFPLNDVCLSLSRRSSKDRPGSKTCCPDMLDAQRQPSPRVKPSRRRLLVEPVGIEPTT